MQISFHETTFTPVVFRLFAEPEAQMNAMAAEAAAFYDASPVPHTFPTGSPDTAPALGTCCASPDSICAPDATRWTSPPFSDLDFDVTGLSRYAYTFTSSGSGASATFTVTARADFDCDTSYRSHTLQGSVASDGSVVIGPVALSDVD